MFRPLKPGQNALRTGHKCHVYLLLARLNLLDNPPVCPPSHPPRFRKWRHVWAGAIYAKLAMQLGKEVVRAIDRPEALDGIAKTVAMPARKKPATTVEIRGTPAAVHAVARYITDE